MQPQGLFSPMCTQSNWFHLEFHENIFFSVTEKEQERNVHLEAVGPGRPAGGAVHLGAQEQVQLDKVQVQEQVQAQQQVKEQVFF